MAAEGIHSARPAGETCRHCGGWLEPCHRCGAPMPAYYRFCGGCGAALDEECPHCRTATPRAHPFCGACGERKQPTAAPVTLSSSTTAAPRDEERRRVAILFADLSGSTALVGQMEVEAGYRLISECVSGMAQQVTEAGGYVVKILGDGLMAIFGAPVAHGDDPVRAGRTALRLQAWLGEFAANLGGEEAPRLGLRVGINYGSVVAASLSTGDRASYDVLGDAVNVAQRVETATEPGAVCVSEAFYRVTRLAFEYRDRGAAWVKGKREPLQLYELTRERPQEQEPAFHQFPLVGREAELALLTAAVDRLGEGQGAALALVGLPGMGKTRLLAEVSEALAERDLPTLHGIGRERSSPLAFWRDWVAGLLSLERTTTWDAARVQVAATLDGSPAAEWSDLLAALVVEPARLRLMDDEQNDHALLAALGAFVATWSGGKPAALVVDEAALLDALSLRLLVELATRGHSPTPILLVMGGTSSLDYPPQRGEVLELQPLDEGAARAWLMNTLGETELHEPLLRRVVERAGGSPLYLQLMLTAAVESAEPLRLLAEVPDTVYGLVQPQVDALAAAEREVAQRAAVLGRQFPEAWLRELAQFAEIAELVARLEQRGILLELRPEPARELALRDGALQEVLYEGLLQDRRRELHALAAAIVSRDAAVRPDLLATAAWHWTCSGDLELAATWSLRAAHHAAALYAGHEAAELYDAAQDLAERCSRPEWAAEAEIGLAEVSLHRGEFAQALELFRAAAARLDEPSAGFSELRATADLGQARVHGRTGSLAEAAPLLESALSTLCGLETPTARRTWIGALIEQSHVLRDLGQLSESKQAALAALEAAERHGWSQEAVSAGAALGMVYPRLGDWPSAERVLRTAITAAQQCGDWKGEASCWINLGAGLQGAGRLEEATAAFDRALHLATRIGDAEKTAIIRLDLGTVNLNRGEWVLAETAYRAAAEEFRRMAHPLGVAAALCNLADTLRWGGKVDEAAPVLEETAEALEAVDAAFLHIHLVIARSEQKLAEGHCVAASELAERALHLAREAEYGAGANLALLSLGRCLRSRQDHPAAERALREALAGFIDSGEALETARTQLELAAVLESIGNQSEGVSLKNEGAQTIRRLGASTWLAHAPTAGSPS